MNKINGTRISVFVAFQLVACFLAWLGGYDFDTRNFWVAYVAGVSIFFGALAATYPGIGDDR